MENPIYCECNKLYTKPIENTGILTPFSFHEILLDKSELSFFVHKSLPATYILTLYKKLLQQAITTLLSR